MTTQKKYAIGMLVGIILLFGGCIAGALLPTSQEVACKKIKEELGWYNRPATQDEILDCPELKP